jgi:hypothetical protein
MDSKRYAERIEKWLASDGYELDELLGKISFKDATPINQKELDGWFAKWIQQIPEDKKHLVVDVMDQVLYHLSNSYQSSARSEGIEQKILREARLFQSDLEQITDMQRLSFHEAEYIEEALKNKHYMYALTEGGVAGTGHPLLLIMDFPALLMINMNMVHHIASTYGYSLKIPTEQLLALKVLHAAVLPKSYRQPAWEWLMHQYNDDDEWSLYVHDSETLVQPEWLETLAKQWVKSMVLYGIRKTSKKKMSWLGIGLAALSNYQFTKQVGEFASHFYRYRFLDAQEKSGTY